MRDIIDVYNKCDDSEYRQKKDRSEFFVYSIFCHNIAIFSSLQARIKQIFP